MKEGWTFDISMHEVEKDRRSRVIPQSNPERWYDRPINSRADSLFYHRLLLPHKTNLLAVKRLRRIWFLINAIVHYHTIQKVKIMSMNSTIFLLILFLIYE